MISIRLNNRRRRSSRTHRPRAWPQRWRPARSRLTQRRRSRTLLTLLKTCAGCFHTFPVEEIHKGGGRCSSCARAKWREANRRRGSAYRRGYTKDWKRMVELAVRAQPYCSYCGSTEDLTGDHITPVSVGGLNTPSNIRVLCRACNSSRGAKTKRSTRPRIHVPNADADDAPTVG